MSLSRQGISFEPESAQIDIQPDFKFDLCEKIANYILK